MIAKRKLGVGRYGILDVYATMPNQCPKCGGGVLKEIRDDIFEKLPEAVWNSYSKRHEYKWLHLSLSECALCGYSFVQEGFITSYYMPESSFNDDFIIDNIELKYSNNSTESFGTAASLIILLGSIISLFILVLDLTGLGFFKNIIISILTFLMFCAAAVTVDSALSKKK